MNGYTMLIDKETRILDFLTICDTDEESKDKVLFQLRWIFDEKQAREVLDND